MIRGTNKKGILRYLRIVVKVTKTKQKNSVQHLGTRPRSQQPINLMCCRMEPIVPRSLNGIMSQQRVASHKRAMTKVAWPGHFLVLGGLVAFEIMDPAKGFSRAELTAEGHCICNWVVDHDGSLIVPDHRHALGSWEGQLLLLMVVSRGGRHYL